MILIDSARDDERGLQQAITFVAQLNFAGLPACMAEEMLPPDVQMPHRYEAQPFLRPSYGETIDALVIIGANAPDDTKLAKIRRLRLSEDAPVLLFGHFETRQEEISAIARFSYVTSRTPDCINLEEFSEISAGRSACPCFGVPTPPRERPFFRGRTPVQVFAPNFTENAIMAGVNIMRATASLTPIVLTSGKAKSQWLNQYGPGAHVYGYSEILPHVLSDMTRILVLAGDVGTNYRALTGLNNHILSGSAIIDATLDGSYEAMGLPVLRGPSDLSFLPPYLNDIVVPNLDGITAETQNAADTSRIGLQAFLKRSALAPWLSATPTSGSTGKKSPAGRVVFKPTNGVGLGHAQRCALIAAHMPAKPRPEFLAFPSCVPLINRMGFDAVPLVQRSHLHADGTANDLVNFSRLDSRLNENDLIVFDGGYVFDSIYRTIISKNLRAIWLRRGLWNAAQDNRIPLDREKVFERVIVPQEALPDLNEAYSGGRHVINVGPVVQEIDRKKVAKKVRAGLAKKYGIKFDRLIVTMLGGGVAADLSSHAQAVANAVEARQDALNLVVVWPGAAVPPAWYCWERTKVVMTHHAGLLSASADLMVSAAGYNGFHEALYNRIPSIFVPQVAAYMDDQTRRAELADDMGVAVHVPPNKPGSFDRQIGRILDGKKGEDIRAALASLDLPDTGTAQAAALIKEFAP